MKKSTKYILIGVGILVISMPLFILRRGKAKSNIEKV